MTQTTLNEAMAASYRAEIEFLRTDRDYYKKRVEHLEEELRQVKGGLQNIIKISAGG